MGFYKESFLIISFIWMAVIVVLIWGNKTGASAEDNMNNTVFFIFAAAAAVLWGVADIVYWLVH